MAFDEFSLLADNAAEAGLTWSGAPEVRRVPVEVEGGRTVSALVWGSGAPEVVLMHGGAQNAHTWDTVALALARPVVAVDLPGHGHSSWRDDHRYSPRAMADDVAVAVRQLAPKARVVVGMSLGGLTALCLAQAHPELVARLVLVDITPGTDAVKAEPILAFLAGPERFASFQEIVDRTVAFNPSRSESSLRRGVLHNARELPDGSWTWRWDPAARWRSRATGANGPAGGERFGSLWAAVDRLTVPLLLIRGGRSRVVSDEDAAELLRRQPGAQVEVIPDAGHSIQGDCPVRLADRIAGFLDS